VPTIVVTDLPVARERAHGATRPLREATLATENCQRLTVYDWKTGAQNSSLPIDGVGET
jgi:hypothetical protein